MKTQRFRHIIILYFIFFNYQRRRRRATPPLRRGPPPPPIRGYTKNNIMDVLPYAFAVLKRGNRNYYYYFARSIACSATLNYTTLHGSPCTSLPEHKCEIAKPPGKSILVLFVRTSSSEMVCCTY